MWHLMHGTFLRQAWAWHYPILSDLFDQRLRRWCIKVNSIHRSFYSSDKSQILANDIQKDQASDLSNIQRHPAIFAPTSNQIAESNRLFTQGQNLFITSAINFDQVTADLQSSLPEIAFIGRSNVGKSSLLNALTNQKKLARASKKPGRTKLLNFFSVDNKLLLVDTPGYGYKSPRYFIQLVVDYLQKRDRLRSCCLLIDSRHGFKSNDVDALKALEEIGLSYQVVLTKIDCLSKGQTERQLYRTYDIVKNTYCCLPQVFPVSARENEGLAQLRSFLAHVTNNLMNK